MMALTDGGGTMSKEEDWTTTWKRATLEETTM